MSDKDHMSFLDELDNNAPPKREDSKLMQGLLIFSIVLGCLALSLYFARDRFSKGKALVPTTTDLASAQKPNNLDPYADTSLRFATAVMNLNYNTLTEDAKRAADLMSDDLSDYYLTRFLSTDFRRDYLERKIYIQSQVVNKPVLETFDQSQNEAVFKVSGINFFNSDVNGTQIQLEFALSISVAKMPDGSYKVVNFRQRIL